MMRFLRDLTIRGKMSPAPCVRLDEGAAHPVPGRATPLQHHGLGGPSRLQMHDGKRSPYSARPEDGGCESRSWAGNPPPTPLAGGSESPTKARREEGCESRSWTGDPPPTPLAGGSESPTNARREEGQHVSLEACLRGGRSGGHRHVNCKSRDRQLHTPAISGRRFHGRSLARTCTGGRCGGHRHCSRSFWLPARPTCGSPGRADLHRDHLVRLLSESCKALNLWKSTLPGGPPWGAAAASALACPSAFHLPRKMVAAGTREATLKQSTGATCRKSRDAFKRITAAIHDRPVVE